MKDLVEAPQDPRAPWLPGRAFKSRPPQPMKADLIPCDLKMEKAIRHHRMAFMVAGAGFEPATFGL